MLKHLSINVPLVEALEQMPGYAKFMKDLVTKKISVSRMMIECIIVVLLLQDLSYKRKKIRGHSLFLVQSGHYIFSENIMCSRGKHKSHAPLNLQEVGFG